jgi:hypothetical protein
MTDKGPKDPYFDGFGVLILKPEAELMIWNKTRFQKGN